jgi:hypothetical protein
MRFSQLVQFVRKEAKKLNDPVYGKEALCGSQEGGRSTNSTNHVKSRFQRMKASCATKLEATEQPSVTSNVRPKPAGIITCQYCQKTHTLYSCDVF